MKTALLLVNALCLTVGICGGPMVTRLYFIHGGKRVWLASMLEGGGWPINLTVLVIIYLFRRHNEGPAAKRVFMGGRLFAGAAITGILSGVDYFLYVYGVARLPISTSSLIAATHPTFVAIFAYFLVKQKFTPYSINAVVVLTVGAGVLALHTSGDRPKGESSREYYMGFFMTIADAVLFGFILPFMELSYRKARQDVTYTLVLEFQLVMSFVATIVGTIGMIVNHDFKAIAREARDFGLGETMYYVVLLSNAVCWQCAFLGSIGVTFVGSALLSAIIITIGLQGTEILGVILYKEKFSAEKGVALVLSLWGFFSYFYGEVKHSKEKSEIQSTMEETSLTLSVAIESAEKDSRNPLALPLHHE